MQIPQAIQHYAQQKGLSLQDAAQTFLQVIMLRHLNVASARFMGGTALVLGYGNPRFSEDIDLTQVSDPQQLRAGLVKSAAELQGWFGSPVDLLPPKATGRTWRLTVRLGRAQSFRLHIDSQAYPALSQQAVIIQYPSLPNCVVDALTVDEIMADKVIALAYRRYLGGRDLFDLWFHWWRMPIDPARQAKILDFVSRKIEERQLDPTDLKRRLKARCLENTESSRVRDEWQRYLPKEFQSSSIAKQIEEEARRLPELFT